MATIGGIIKQAWGECHTEVAHLSITAASALGRFGENSFGMQVRQNSRPLWKSSSTVFFPKLLCHKLFLKNTFSSHPFHFPEQVVRPQLTAQQSILCQHAGRCEMLLRILTKEGMFTNY